MYLSSRSSNKFITPGREKYTFHMYDDYISYPLLSSHSKHMSVQQRPSLNYRFIRLPKLPTVSSSSAMLCHFKSIPFNKISLRIARQANHELPVCFLALWNGKLILLYFLFNYGVQSSCNNEMHKYYKEYFRRRK